jgi:hypothetical protein
MYLIQYYAIETIIENLVNTQISSAKIILQTAVVLFFLYSSRQ